ncbi:MULTISPECIES: hypothetical protein [unclassified Streptomyces]|uniref:hypothetical protein n=1 Tax=unclassified Streptomyces TaxID=2593676 RepID=UPI001F04F065|nr:MULTISPECIES: hypothetical protein [unclassified Streptomyces]MCH0561810.1 hypothetical protein [Streptomyces sp. MUM 2J]MCH0568877.1 hypothetical protein [Streptomyces sp. MUM 136J]
MPDSTTRSQHPLAQLRALTGDTQLSYAELVAETHEALGFGKLRKRREKVSRWETQGVPPDHNTQLSMAHIHQVPEEEVQRLGWPHWLHLGTAAISRTARPRAREEAVDVECDKERPTVHLGRSRLTLTGTGLSAFVREILAAVASPPQPAALGRHRVTPDTVTLVEERSNALYELVSVMNPVRLHRVSRAELALASALVTDNSYDRATGARLLLVTAQLAHLCGFLSKGLGEDVRAERYYVAAARAAARAGSPSTVSLCLADLAWSHIDTGAPREVLTLVQAARAVTPRPPARLAAVLHSREARAHARLGEIIVSARAVDQTSAALASGSADEDTSYVNVDDTWLSVAAGRAWLDAGQSKRALEHFAPLLGAGPRPGPPGQPPLLIARDLLAVVDAQLSLRDVESAVAAARAAASLFERMPCGLSSLYRGKFTAHTAVSAVRELDDLLVRAPAV